MYLLGSLLLLLYSKHEAINPILHNNSVNVRLHHKCTTWTLGKTKGRDTWIFTTNTRNLSIQNNQGLRQKRGEKKCSKTEPKQTPQYVDIVVLCAPVVCWSFERYSASLNQNKENLCSVYAQV